MFFASFCFLLTAVCCDCRLSAERWLELPRVAWLLPTLVMCVSVCVSTHLCFTCVSRSRVPLHCN